MAIPTNGTDELGDIIQNTHHSRGGYKLTGVYDFKRSEIHSCPLTTIRKTIVNEHLSVHRLNLI